MASSDPYQQKGFFDSGWVTITDEYGIKWTYHKEFWDKMLYEEPGAKISCSIHFIDLSKDGL